MGVPSEHRIAQACESCRRQKIRCLPAGTTCQRCQSLHIPCQPHLPSRRSRRSAKVDRLEKRIGELQESLGKEKIFQPGTFDSHLISPHRYLDAWSTPGTQDVRPAARLAAVLQLKYDRLDLQHLYSLGPTHFEDLLDAFRNVSMRSHVVSLPTADIHDLTNQHPFLLLAALVVGSSSRPDLQIKLGLLYRYTLAQNVIVQGQRSLDILQSLLIYLAWQHHYLRYEDEQIYQYIQLAIGMVYDLELHKGTQDLDSARAYISCYYLSTGISVLGLRRPNNLKCYDAMTQSALQLASSAESESDRFAPARVDLLKIAEDILEHIAVAPTFFDFLRSSLRQWKMKNLRQGVDAATMALYYHIELTISERMLVANGRGDGMRLECLLQAQHLLDHFISQPLLYFRSMTRVEWMHFVSGTVALSRLSTTSDARASALAYLQQETAIMRDLLEHSEQWIRADALFGWYLRLLQGVIGWVNRQQNGDNQERMPDGWCPFETVKKMCSKMKPGGGSPTAQAAGENTVPSDNAFWDQFLTDWSALPSGWMLPLNVGVWE